MRDYSNSKIYKIIVNTDEEYLPYIGSTTEKYLSKRMDNHRRNYLYYKNNKDNNKGYISSYILFDKFGIENCKIELIELYSCSCTEELLMRERYWFDTIKNCNKMKPYVSIEEEKERYLNWIKNNKDFLIKYNKEYRKKNRDELLQKNKDYKENHKKEILIQMKEKYICLCGVESLKWNKARHERSKKHQDFLTFQK